jgi:hypothetical protein
MSRSLIMSVLRAVDKRGKFLPSKELTDFAYENGFGTFTGKQVSFSVSERRKMRQLLLAQHGVPLDATVTSWDDITRAEALEFGTNEKLSKRRVRAGRVAVKSLPGRPLNIGGKEVSLPSGSSLDFDVEAIVSAAPGSILVVENWEAFEALDRMKLEKSAALMPEGIAIYRGDKDAYPVAAAHRALHNLTCPVYSCPDVDGSGLMIALGLPRYSGLVLPDLDLIADLFEAGAGDRERFLVQLPSCEAKLSEATCQEVHQLWRIIRKFGRALPQEKFIELL